MKNDSLAIAYRHLPFPDMGTLSIEAWCGADEVGGVTVRPLESGTLHVESIAVSPNHFRRGIGTGLVVEALSAHSSVSRVTVNIKTDASWGLFTALRREYHSIEFELVDYREEERQILARYNDR